MEKEVRTVGVIGGGSAGLCTARHLLAAGLQPLVWEAAAKPGGIWLYSPRTSTDKHGFPLYTSIYSNLRTNLPKEVMEFPDFPFHPSHNSFPHHTAVAQYLAHYATHFKLDPYIKTEHHVERVERIDGCDGTIVWAVTVQDLQRGTTTTQHCDALVVCNGHYSARNIPHLPGVEQYEGRQLHSRDYRHPEPFTDTTVLVLGAGASGLDICIEVSSVAKKVYLSHNLSSNIANLPDNVQQVKGAKQATRSGFSLTDGSHVEADVIIYCTGYNYAFPFLTESCGMTVEDNRVMPLYKHIFNATFPSMAFIGITTQMCPFPSFDMQARFVAKVLIGKVSLPDRVEMMAAVQQRVVRHQQEGKSTAEYHVLRDEQWDYLQELANQAGEKMMMSPAVLKLFTDVREHRIKFYATFRNTNYRITGPDSYEVVH